MDLSSELRLMKEISRKLEPLPYGAKRRILDYLTTWAWQTQSEEMNAGIGVAGAAEGPSADLVPFSK